MTASAARQVATSRHRRRIPGSTASTYSAIGRREQQRQRVVADRQAEHDRGGHEPAVGALAARIVERGAPPILPAARAAGAGRRRARGGARARRRACRSPRRCGVSASPSPAADPEPASSRVSDADEVDRDAGGQPRRRSPRAGSSGTPARRTAGARSRRASRGARRSGSRSGGPCPGAARRLELGRVPERRRRACSAAAPRARTRSAPTADRREARDREPALTIRAGCPRRRPTG